MVSSFLSEKNFFREISDGNDSYNLCHKGFGNIESGNGIPDMNRGFRVSQELKGEKESLFGLRLNNICRKDWKLAGAGKIFGDEQLMTNLSLQGNRKLSHKGNLVNRALRDLDRAIDRPGVSPKTICFGTLSAKQEIVAKVEDCESILNFTNFSSQLSFMHEKFSSGGSKRNLRCICTKKSKILSEHASPNSGIFELKEKSPGGSLDGLRLIGRLNFSSKGNSEANSNSQHTSSCSIVTQNTVLS